MIGRRTGNGDALDHQFEAFESRNFGVALLESFVLNKHIGLAIWTNAQAKGLLAEVPESQTIYLACL